MGLPWYCVHTVVFNDSGRDFYSNNAYCSSCWLGRFDALYYMVTMPPTTSDDHLIF